MEKTEEKIRRLRQAAGLSQASFAQQLGITQGGYQAIESGRAALTLDRLKQIANILNVNAGSLLEDEHQSSEVRELKQQVQLLDQVMEAKQAHKHLFTLALRRLESTADLLFICTKVVKYLPTQARDAAWQGVLASLDQQAQKQYQGEALQRFLAMNKRRQQQDLADYLADKVEDVVKAIQDFRAGEVPQTQSDLH
jgi:transcriptional regulator with XRE-family HTH domain